MGVGFLITFLLVSGLRGFLYSRVRGGNRGGRAHKKKKPRPLPYPPQPSSSSEAERPTPAFEIREPYQERRVPRHPATLRPRCWRLLHDSVTHTWAKRLPRGGRGALLTGVPGTYTSISQLAPKKRAHPEGTRVGEREPLQELYAIWP